MKRILLGVLAAGIVLSIGATTVFASGMHNGQGNAFCLSGVCQTGSCPNYVDADGDGQCDNCDGSHGACPTGSCTNYVDADGDGLCDNCDGSHGTCQTSSCSNYVDTDGDGLCDNHSANHDGCGNRAAWSGAGHHNGCREECRDSRCGANRR